MKCEYCEWYRLWLQEGTSQPVYDPTAADAPTLPEDVRVAWEVECCEPYLNDGCWMRACELLCRLAVEEDPEDPGYRGPFSLAREKMLRLSPDEILREWRNLLSRLVQCPTCSREPRGSNLNEILFMIERLRERTSELALISPQELGERLCRDTPERDLVNFALSLAMRDAEQQEDPVLLPVALTQQAEIHALRSFLNDSSPARPVSDERRGTEEDS